MTDTLPIYDQLATERYPGPNAIQRHPEAPPVNLLADIRDEIANAIHWTEAEFRSALPTVAHLADTADAVANSTAAKAILGAVLSPADEAFIVSLVNRLDQGAHQAETDAGEAPAPEPEPAPEAPADPGSIPVGPFVGGQAQ